MKTKYVTFDELLKGDSNGTTQIILHKNEPHVVNRYKRTSIHGHQYVELESLHWYRKTITKVLREEFGKKQLLLWWKQNE